LFGKPASRLRGHHNVSRALFPQAGREPFAATVTVDVGGVDEVHAGVDGGMKRAHGIGVVDGSPGAADGQAPKLIAETVMSVRPSFLYSMASSAGSSSRSGANRNLVYNLVA